MLFSNLLHLHLHDFVLIDHILVWDGALGVVRVVMILGLLNWLLLFLGKAHLLRLSLVWVNLRLISLSCIVITESCLQRVEVLRDKVLVVIVVSCRSHIALLVSVGVSHVVLGKDMLLGRFLFNILVYLAWLVGKWLGMLVVSAERSLVLSLVSDRTLRVLHLLKLLLLMVFAQHAFEVVARHRAWTWVPVAIRFIIYVTADHVCTLIVRRRQLWPILLSDWRVLTFILHACMVAVQIRVDIVAWHIISVVICFAQERICHFFKGFVRCSITEIRGACDRPWLRLLKTSSIRCQNMLGSYVTWLINLILARTDRFLWFKSHHFVWGRLLLLIVLLNIVCHTILLILLLLRLIQITALKGLIFFTIFVVV